MKRMIIRNVLAKYYDEDKHTYSKFLKTDKKTKSDLALIMKYLDENISQEIKSGNDFVLWFKLMRYSDKSIDDAIKKVINGMNIKRILKRKIIFHCTIFMFCITARIRWI